ncbi:actin cytoskeleton-regulatory complex protein END3-domain-containing protein [Pyronema omphalodes]|nr:actin cytoskeleton-regulatory complex protein END3-domain-containing protein [Pyronema omphalodes]
MSRKPISQADIDKYWEIFSHHSQGNLKITGDQASSILRNSGLSDNQLAKIWDLADIDRDGDLDFEEFCVAMRLIYEIINGDLKTVPKTLPDWLIPESKLHLVRAKDALDNGGEEFERPEPEDDTPGLKNGFEWYMAPADKRKYEDIYMANSGTHGQIAFAALNELYDSIDVPDTEITRAWNMVNPSKTTTIGKDQCIAFLHMLSNRHEGYRIPASIPASLRASFEQNKINYDIESVKPPQRASGPDRNTISGKKAAFGESYITRLGIGGASTYKHSGTDFSSTKDEDWEEVRLKRELADLEKQIADAEAAAEKRRNRDRHGASGASTIALVKRELEQMLDYKRRELRNLDEGTGLEAGKSLKSVRDDLDMVKEQVDALEGHLRRREAVLQQVLAEIEDEKARR